MPSLLSFLIEAAYPDAERDGTAACEPYRTLRLLGVIRSIIDYATQLIGTARMQAGSPGFAAFSAHFGTDSLKLLIARFRCAISRAAHLEQKLRYDAEIGGLRRRAPARKAPADRAPRARPAAPAARPDSRKTERAIDPELAHLPSVAQIAAELRRHPMEHVFATICRDLGITSDHALWLELDQALAAFGVRLSPVAPREQVVPRRHAPTRRPARSPAAAQPTQPNRAAQTPPPLCTGPPPIANNIAA
ncbi:MAG TPA: hypothetical protein VGG99_04185 [Acetobacteraceae bacterium]|jgi:hypothetical protein